VQRLIAHIENPNDHIKITACMPERNDIAIVDTINQITFDEKFDAKVFWCLFNSKLINWYCYRFILARLFNEGKSTLVCLRSKGLCSPQWWGDKGY
jgi:hypothetical protein